MMLLQALLELVGSTLNAEDRIRDGSRLGESEMDRSARRWTVGAGGTFIVGLLVFLWWRS